MNSASLAGPTPQRRCRGRGEVAAVRPRLAEPLGLLACVLLGGRGAHLFVLELYAVEVCVLARRGLVVLFDELFADEVEDRTALLQQAAPKVFGDSDEVAIAMRGRSGPIQRCSPRWSDYHMSAASRHRTPRGDRGRSLAPPSKPVRDDVRTKKRRGASCSLNRTIAEASARRATRNVCARTIHMPTRSCFTPRAASTSTARPRRQVSGPLFMSDVLLATSATGAIRPNAAPTGPAGAR